MSLRSVWTKAKGTAEKTLGKGFLGGHNLGPLLDKAEKAEAAYDKLPGTTEHAKLAKAKKKAYDAYAKTDKPVASYMKIVKMAEKANRDDKEKKKALHDLNSVLSMKISVPIAKKMKLLHGH